MATVSRNLVISKSNLTGFSAVSPDPLDILTQEGFEDLAANTYISSVYQGATISVDLEFKVRYIGALDVEEGILPATSVTSNYDFTTHGITTAFISSNLLRISGTYANVFSNEYYNFVLNDMSTIQLPATTQVDFLALIEYNMPNPVTVDKEYTFSVVARTDFSSPTPTSSIAGQMNQWVVWNYAPTVSSILSLVAQGV